MNSIRANYPADSNAGDRPTRTTIVFGSLALVIAVGAIVCVQVSNMLWSTAPVRFKPEIDQLDAAVKAFREHDGDYPPSFGGSDLSHSLPQWERLQVRMRL